MEKLVGIFDLVFGCHHRHLSRVFTIDRRTYRVCCNCGKKFNYSLEKMSMQRGWGIRSTACERVPACARSTQLFKTR